MSEDSGVVESVAAVLLQCFDVADDATEGIKFVASANLTYEQRSDILHSIEEVEARHNACQERTRALSRLLSEGDCRGARAYVKSLPIEKRAKDAILAKLPGQSWWEKLF